MSAALRIGPPEVVVETIGGNCPVQAEGTVGYLAWLDGYSPATRGSNSYLEFLREAQ